MANLSLKQILFQSHSPANDNKNLFLTYCKRDLNSVSDMKTYKGSARGKMRHNDDLKGELSDEFSKIEAPVKPQRIPEKLPQSLLGSMNRLTKGFT